MSFEPITVYAMRCDANTRGSQCRTTFHVPDEEEPTAYVQAQFEKPELTEGIRLTAVDYGWHVGHRVLCPDHRRSLEYMASAAIDGLPFDGGSEATA